MPPKMGKETDKSKKKSKKPNSIDVPKDPDLDLVPEDQREQYITPANPEENPGAVTRARSRASAAAATPARTSTYEKQLKRGQISSSGE